METYDFILWLFIVSAIFLSLIFYYIYRSSVKSEAEAPGMKNSGKKRFLFALILFSLLTILASVTIPKSPYFLFANEIPSKVVFVDARQFAYKMDYNAIDAKSYSPGQDIVLPRDKPVEFRVTSSDVNHAFGIYDKNFKLITQTQAMPGYVNKLRWQFRDTGIYHILCLEYCGSMHAFMRSSFTVSDESTAQRNF